LLTFADQLVVNFPDNSQNIQFFQQILHNHHVIRAQIHYKSRHENL
jgi:hypothetical protein